MHFNSYVPPIDLCLQKDWQSRIVWAYQNVQLRGCKLTIRWLMTAVRARWSPLKQCRLRARHSNRAWLHIWSSRGPNDSSETRKYNTEPSKQYNTNLTGTETVPRYYFTAMFQQLSRIVFFSGLPLQRRMCVAMRCNCCLKKDMLVWVTSTPSNTVTEDSLYASGN